MATKVGDKIFRCTDCGCETLEEILVDVTQSTAIDIIDAGAADYGEVLSIDGGSIARVQCSRCGAEIAEGNDAYEQIFNLAKGNDPNFVIAEVKER